MLQRTYLTGLAMALLAAQACGSDDGKKKAPYEGDAGMAGQAGSPDVNAGGSSAGSPGEPPIEGGAGGAAPEVTAGMGGAPEVAGGAGGQPSQAPEPELLFTVRGQGGTPGLPGTALNAAEHPQNVIYTSSTGSQDRVNGTNAVKVTGADMGLADTDPIVAFSLVQPEPANPLFLFSVADGTEGSDQSRVYGSYNEDGSDEQSHLYYSEGTQSTRYVGEGGDEYGYNAILATQVSLGLTGDTPDGPAADDLVGLAVHDALQPLGDLYFTVPGYALGAVDSAVATVAADERACTVFKTARDGTNSVAFTCADLGLAPEDEIDGLALWGDSDPTQVVFSVTVGSQGAVGSAVETVVATPAGAGATLFASTGDGANAVLKSDRDLGLGERYYGQLQEIDGFTVVSAPAKASVTHADTCQVTYDPFGVVNVGGELSYINGTSHVGRNILILVGQTATQGTRLLAYNATTCAFLQQKAMPSAFANPGNWTIAPLPGWSQATPLDNVEYLAITDDDQGVQKAISRYDAAGVFVQLFPINDTAYYESPSALVYEPAGDKLFVLLRGQYDQRDRMAVFPRPSAADTTLEATFHSLSTPCANQPEINGTDAAGNLYLAKAQTSGTGFKVCVFRPDGELLPLAYSWATTEMSDRRGFLVPGGSHFVLNSDVSPVQIERGAYQAP